MQQAGVSSSYPCENTFWAKVKLCPDSLDIVANLSSQMLLYEANNTITASSYIRDSSRIVYEALHSIILNPFFNVELGSLFEAYIEGCGENH